jgi:hypothetical protein
MSLNERTSTEQPLVTPSDVKSNKFCRNSVEDDERGCHWMPVAPLGEKSPPQPPPTITTIRMLLLNLLWMAIQGDQLKEGNRSDSSFNQM